MARPTIMKIALIIALTMAAGSAHASVISSAVQIGVSSFTPSNNVSIGVKSDAAAYSAHAKHSGGNRYVAFSSADAKLYFSTVEPTTAFADVAASSTYLTMPSGWTSM